MLSLHQTALIHPSIWFHRRPSRVLRNGRKERAHCDAGWAERRRGGERRALSRARAGAVAVAAHSVLTKTVEEGWQLMLPIERMERGKNEKAGVSCPPRPAPTVAHAALPCSDGTQPAGHWSMGASCNGVVWQGCGRASILPLLFSGPFEVCPRNRKTLASKHGPTHQPIGLTATRLEPAPRKLGTTCQPMFWNLAPPHMFGRENQTTACWGQPGASSSAPEHSRT